MFGLGGNATEDGKTSENYKIYREYYCSKLLTNGNSTWVYTAGSFERKWMWQCQVYQKVLPNYPSASRKLIWTMLFRVLTR